MKDLVALQKIQSALTSASETQLARCILEEEYGIADLNPMAT